MTPWRRIRSRRDELHLPGRSPDRSSACPWSNQSLRFIRGVLYLENKAGGATCSRPRGSRLLETAGHSQAAISLGERPVLYSDLREREARIRGLIDSKHHRNRDSGMSRGRIIEAQTKAFLNIVGYAREDLISGSAADGTELTPGRMARCRRPGLGRAENVLERCNRVRKSTSAKDGSRVADF